jgi:hypothetical protein
MRILLLGLLLGVSALGFAEPKKLSKGEKAKEEQLKKDAAYHYDLQEYEQTLASFQEAYRISNDPNILFNIGATYGKLKRYEDAISSYNSFLAEAPNSLAASYAKEAIAQLQDLLKEGSIEVSTNQDPAEIYIDGNKKGSSPATIGGLAPGKHTIAVEKVGFKKYQEELTLKVGQNIKLNVVLKSIPCSLEVSTNQDPANVYLDGKLVGTSLYRSQEILEGAHKLALQKKGFQKYEEELLCTPAQNFTLKPSLEVAIGELEIFANVVGAAVFLDGKKVGLTSSTGTLPLSEIPVGEHEVLVTFPPFQNFQQTFILVEDEPLTIEAALLGSSMPKSLYTASALAGGTGIILGAVALSFVAKGNTLQRREGSFQDEIDSNIIQGVFDKALIFGITADVTVGAAVVSSGAAYFLRRQEKKVKTAESR